MLVLRAPVRHPVPITPLARIARTCAASTAPTPTPATLRLDNTDKREALRALEHAAQQRWERENVFELDAAMSDGIRPADKWLGTAPYPYMNGRLHLGHAFSYSKVEFAAGFQRLQGKKALFPFGFHATGMPIPAAADRLRHELAASDGNLARVPPACEGSTTQTHILESMGIPSSEAAPFADARYWLSYFPPLAERDLRHFGCRIDWRRSFITTDANPYYDSFVSWQFNRLHAQGRIQFGARYTVWSARDGGACLDHDRSVGEGLGVTEYTAIRLPVQAWRHSAPDQLRQIDLPAVLVAATLRPETMYGQTNVFVGPDIQYGLYRVKGEAVVATEAAMRNMAFQGLTGLERGEMPTLLAQVRGADLVGALVDAPLSVYGSIRVLPMPSVRADMGTGIVTSVPSDAPADWAQLLHLRAKPELYSIDPSWAALDPVDVVSTPSYGTRSAPHLVQQLKIHSPRDTHLLEQAKDLAYSEGFHKGTLAVGPFKGMSVTEARPHIRQQLLDARHAFPYADLEGTIISRSGEACVAALADQWFLDYGAGDWKTKARLALEQMETFSPETRAGFAHTIDWLREWACARSYGLGTRLPWDKRYLIESLSDSTIYMAYYTVAYLLQGRTLDGRSRDGQPPGPLGIQAEDLTDDVWEYIFADGPVPASQIPHEALDKLRNEFRYWYPVDLRSSGKDLIGNHMTFSLFTHAELFPPEQWPKGMRANGHLLLNGEKMSKSKGNALTLAQGVEKFGADAMRLALADAGDGIDDANFEEQQANANILRLHTLIEWAQKTCALSTPGLREDSSALNNGEAAFWDACFQAEMDALTLNAQQAYNNCSYQQANKAAWYGMLGARDAYRDAVASCGGHTGPGMDKELVRSWIARLAIIASPIIPHVAEHLWSTVLANPTSIQQAHWPAVTQSGSQAVAQRRAALAQLSFVRSVARQARLHFTSPLREKAALDLSRPTEIVVLYAAEVPAWQRSVVSVVRDHLTEQGVINEGSSKKDLGRKGLLRDKRVHKLLAQLQVR